MDKLLPFALAIAVSLGTTAALAHLGHAAQEGQAQFSTDGAFRDGLYVGRLTAESGRAPRPPIGRWSTDRDRAAFVTGYQSGYKALVAKSLSAMGTGFHNGGRAMLLKANSVK